MDIPLPLPRLTWKEAMDRFGSDKPDMRFGMELKDVSEAVKDCEFAVFKGALEQGGSVRGICVEGQAGDAQEEDRQPGRVCQGLRG